MTQIGVIAALFSYFFVTRIKVHHFSVDKKCSCGV